MWRLQAAIWTDTAKLSGMYYFPRLEKEECTMKRYALWS
jgi:hypothetical protein